MVTCPRCGQERALATRYCALCVDGPQDIAAKLRSVDVPESGLGKLAPLLRSPGSHPDERTHIVEGLYELIRPVEHRLLETHKNQPTFVYAIEMGDYLEGAVIPQLCCEAVGGKAEDALDLSYGYSLGLIAARISDDMMDRSTQRRGKRTVWREFGDPVAIPMTFQLIAEMFETLEGYDVTMGREVSSRVSRVFRAALVESARAEEREKLARRSNHPLTFRDRVEIAEGKRGVLIAAGTTTGAIVGGGTDNEVQLLKEYGLRMGTANQLFDDSGDPDYPKSYREGALSESRDLTAEALKCTDKLRKSEAQRRLRDLSKITEVPLL